MLEAETNDYLEYEKLERFDSGDYRNGYKHKRVDKAVTALWRLKIGKIVLWMKSI